MRQSLIFLGENPKFFILKNGFISFLSANTQVQYFVWKIFSIFGNFEHQRGEIEVLKHQIRRVKNIVVFNFF